MNMAKPQDRCSSLDSWQALRRKLGQAASEVADRNQIQRHIDTEDLLANLAEVHDLSPQRTVSIPEVNDALSAEAEAEKVSDAVIAEVLQLFEAGAKEKRVQGLCKSCLRLQTPREQPPRDRLDEWAERFFLVQEGHVWLVAYASKSSARTKFRRGQQGHVTRLLELEGASLVMDASDSSPCGLLLHITRGQEELILAPGTRRQAFEWAVALELAVLHAQPV